MITEDQIERQAERMMDFYDRQLMRGEFTQAAYDRYVRDLDAWAKAEYAKGRAV